MNMQFPARNAYFIERQERRESSARSYPRRFPMAIARAQGMRITDVEGKTYLDCLSGAGTLALGHNHPVAIGAIRAALDSGAPLHTLDLMTPLKDEYVGELFATLPANWPGQPKIQFCSPSGSDAVEAAVKLAKTATGRSEIVAFRGAYHGMTQGALSMMGGLGPKERLGSLMPGVHFLPYPYAYRCPFGAGGERTAELAAQCFDSALRDPEGGIGRPAAVILEVVQGEGGVVPAPLEWLRAVRRTTQELGIALILDEVQTGCGRTGTFFAFEKAGIVPDILVLSKAIGGGLPMAVVIYREELDAWRPGAHAGTFRGNQLAMAAGLATLRHIAAEGLTSHAARAGERLRARLHDIADTASFVGDIRGEGLMLGIEIVDAEGKPDALGHAPQNGGLASAIQAECFRRGLILEVGGRNGSVLRFLPPLTISDAEIDEVAGILAGAFGRAERQAA